jgi:hypothetical protein
VVQGRDGTWAADITLVENVVGSLQAMLAQLQQQQQQLTVQVASCVNAIQALKKGSRVMPKQQLPPNQPYQQQQQHYQQQQHFRGRGNGKGARGGGGGEPQAGQPDFC